MKKTVKVIYNANTLETTIFVDEKPFDTSRINGKEIADWAYPFMMRKVKWNGFYDEMVEALGGETEFYLVFEGSEEALTELKEAWENAPITVIDENSESNIVTIEYDAETLTTNITIDRQPFDTSRINGKEMEDWVYPFMIRKVKWNGIFEELAAVVGSEEYTIHFSGSSAAVNSLLEECPESVKIINLTELEEKGYHERYENLYQQFIDFSKNGEIEKTIPILIELSEKYADADAQYFLGDSYFEGRGIEQDDAKAVKWLTAAAEQGIAEAQCYLGDFYRYADAGIEENPIEAVKWYKKAAEQGDKLAQLELGDCYLEGYGTKENYTEAAEWYRKAAEQGYPKAQCRLANCYQEGFGVEKDENEADKWYLEAAKNGDTVAQRSIAISYLLDENTTEAVKWLLPAAEQGDADAQLILGRCYLFGGNGVSKNVDEAEKWFALAAEQGVGLAQHHLGSIYANRGNLTEAIKLWRAAGEQGVSVSLLNIGICHLDGNGVTKNSYVAMEYFKKAAECENPHADVYYFLGLCYELGDGVYKDKEKAKKLFRQGSQLGSDKCIEEYNNMVKREERIEKARKREEGLEKAKKVGGVILEGILTVGAAYGQAYLNSLNNNDDNSY